MNRFVANLLNPLLGIFGRRIVRSYIGRWSGWPPVRTIHPIGWRLARRTEYEGLPECATELDRLMASRRETT